MAWKTSLVLLFAGIACASSFLEEPLVRKNQVKNVLEHEPVRGEPLCHHTVRKWSIVPLVFSIISPDNGSHRDDIVRLRDYREC